MAGTLALIPASTKGVCLCFLGVRGGVLWFHGEEDVYQGLASDRVSKVLDVKRPTGVVGCQWLAGDAHYSSRHGG